MTEQVPSPETDAQRAQGLANARIEIDSVDDAMHELLLRRAELVQQVAVSKRQADGTLPKGAYRPGREAQIIRRLYAQNRPPLPFQAVFTLWREMIGAFTTMQAPITVSVLEDPDDSATRGAARDHFGATAALTPRKTLDDIHRDISVNGSVIGVIPARYTIIGKYPWWADAGESNHKSLSVVSALPFVGETIALYCLCDAAPEESGDDQTLFTVTLDTETIKEANKMLKKAQIDGETLEIFGAQALIRIAGFHVADDAAMKSILAQALRTDQSNLAIVGAYPTPLREFSL